MLNPIEELVDTLYPALCAAVVVNADDLKVDIRHGSSSSDVAARPEEVEAGNLIGKKGRIVRSFELLSKLIADKHGWPIDYKVQVGRGDNPPAANRPPLAPLQWNVGDVRSLLESVLSAFLHYTPQIEVANFSYSTTFTVILDEAEPVTPHDILMVIPEFARSDTNDIVDVNQRLTGDDAVRYMLNVIFGAVGKLHGRKCGVTYIRHQSNPDAQQPKRADGRYVKEMDK